MALSYRERLIAFGVAAAAVIYVGDKYALDPYMKARGEVTTDLATFSARNIEASRLLNRKKALETQERAMLATAPATRRRSRAWPRTIPASR